MFQSFFPQPKLFFSSLALWSAVLILVWYSFAKTIGEALGFDLTETENDEFRSPLGWLNSDHCKKAAQKLCHTYDVRTQSLGQPARLLSGGNVQKLLLGRWLGRDPKLLIACQPTRGLDEGAIASIQKLILEVRQKGNAVLLITEDLDELLMLSDRVAVIYNGNLSKSFKPENLDRSKIGLMMAGERLDV